VLVPADLHVYTLDRDPARGACQRPARGPLPAAAAPGGGGRLGLPPAGGERRGQADSGLPDLGAGCAHCDRGIRLRDDPGPCADRVRTAAFCCWSLLRPDATVPER
jgi:hypothetical protein